ncbi:MAG: hypothetical protein HY756_07515 [Nitrospirae bacterium]|nr:hypothetical protein [Nitrospirota bacterium]
MTPCKNNIEESVKPSEAIKKGYLLRLLLLLLTIILAGTVISALVLYINTYRTFDAHYSAALSIITEIKQGLLIKTIRINIFFYLLTAIGAGILLVLYSHRIAGPLYRVKLYAKMLSEGMFEKRIQFRRKDAIHSLAEALNNMSDSYGKRLSMLSLEIKELEDAIKSLGSKPEQAEAALRRAREIDEKIKRLLDAVKV